VPNGGILFTIEAGIELTTVEKSWPSRLAGYKTSDNLRAMFEVVVTVGPFFGLWALMWYLSTVNLWLLLPVSIPAAGFMVRLFMIQHDCGHNALFTSRRANDWLGRVLGVLTLTPYDFWRHSHAMHHAGSGNLDRRGIGDINTLTVEEYRALSRMGRLGYRLYRHPLVMFGLGPAYLFIFRHRLPFGAMRDGTMPWVSTLLCDIGIALLYAVLIYLVGFTTFLAIQLPIVLIGASIGVWLFYVQHQFEDTYWEHHSGWTHQDAALHGSTFYDLPRPLMWLTGYIGIHHVHHLSSRIPFYRLPQVLADHPHLRDIGRLTLWQSIKCVRLTLWDENAKQLVPFNAALTS
jgi:acyl-lipid omega-6 desaturase (Delta-12 desaturase)